MTPGLAQRERLLPFRQFVDSRLGPPPWWRQTYRVLVLPFLAPSFSEFWRRWNPVWGYWLHRVAYRPLRRRSRRTVAVLGTFLASGVVHNVIAVAGTGRVSLFTTLFFVDLGVVVALTEALRIRLTRMPAPLRIPIHLGYLWSTFQLTALLIAP